MTDNPELGQQLQHEITRSVNLLEKCGYTVLSEEETHQYKMGKFKLELISLCLFAWSFALMLKVFGGS